MSGPGTTRSVELVVDGRTFSARAGDSVAAALVNGGVWHFRTSSGRAPRGPLCGMGSCQECRISIDGVPHRRACMAPVAAGMVVGTGLGDARTASSREGDVVGTTLVPGPIPATSGGREAPPELLEAEVVVVGAGPAGLAAATYAAEAGRSVLLLDEGEREGGQIWRHRTESGLPPAGRQGLRRFRASGARAVRGVQVVGSPDRGLLLAEREGCPIRVRWGDGLVLATGARERFLPFPGWILPGVVGVGGVQALLKAGMRVRGLRSVVGGTGPLLLPVAALLSREGAPPEAVVEQTPARRLARFTLGLARRPGKLAEAFRYGTSFPVSRYRPGWWVAEATGDGRVEEVTLTNGRRTRTLSCDLLAVGYGLVPATELPSAVGCAIGGGAVRVDEWQQTTVPGVFCAGECTGVAGADASLLEGAVAGLAAAGRQEAARKLFSARAAQRSFGLALEAAFGLRGELLDPCRDDTILCRCEDVAIGHARTFGSSREAKLRTRVGMGPCQGRVCGVAAASLFGWSPDTVRPPVAPARLNTLVASGDDSIPDDRTHPRHEPNL